MRLGARVAANGVIMPEALPWLLAYSLISVVAIVSGCLTVKANVQRKALH
jgi:hypothetical protein